MKLTVHRPRGFPSTTLWLKLSTLMICYVSSSAMEFLLDLKMPRYVIFGHSAKLSCEYSLPPEQLRKVEWLRGTSSKIFSYVKDRTPPYRNYTLNGSYLDWSHSNDKHIVLRNLTFEASGFYSCQVSTQAPIYTKASNDEELTVIQTQKELPEITELLPVYTVGETLSVNCTSSPSKPSADVTWLVNNKSVPERALKLFPGRTHGEHGVASTTVQLSMKLTEDHVRPDGGLDLTCLSTIPAWHGDEYEYADRRKHSTSVDVVLPPPVVISSDAQSCSQSFFRVASSLQVFVLTYVVHVIAKYH